VRRRENALAREKAAQGGVRISPPGPLPLAGRQWEIGVKACGSKGRAAAVGERRRRYAGAGCRGFRAVQGWGRGKGGVDDLQKSRNAA
jgi:hypothetical protein